MTPNDRLTLASNALAQSPDKSDLTVEEIAHIAADTDIVDKDYPLLVGTIIYIKKRVAEKTGRVPAFKVAFPERCIYTGERDGGYASALTPGDELHKTTIDIKAKRLENSALYKKVYLFLQTGLYITYAIDRMKVLDHALDHIFDDHVADRDKTAYMKLFLEETRKPENAKELEVNFNLTQNNVSIATVEDKMNTIAQALNHASAAEVIEMVHQKEQDDS